mmetsp:Transcript_18226/g.33707  ORF Transcript_18226/g.33707 Transcript_18226/m.33707 type:complete len:215 (+) Transcript_18226:881-1525(+)
MRREVCPWSIALHRHSQPKVGGVKNPLWLNIFTSLVGHVYLGSVCNVKVDARVFTACPSRLAKSLSTKGANYKFEGFLGDFARDEEYKILKETGLGPDFFGLFFDLTGMFIFGKNLLLGFLIVLFYLVLLFGFLVVSLDDILQLGLKSGNSRFRFYLLLGFLASFLCDSLGLLYFWLLGFNFHFVSALFFTVAWFLGKRFSFECVEVCSRGIGA